ncbi:hypothetical protein JCM10212_003945 [Sporobolomyces blumeae]
MSLSAPVPFDAPSSASSPTSTVRYFDLVPDELLDFARKEQIKVLVIDDSMFMKGRKRLPRGFLEEAHNLSQLSVDNDHPFLWITPGSLQHLRFLRATVPLWIPKRVTWAPLLPSLKALSVAVNGPYVLDDKAWPQLFPSLRLLEIDATYRPGSALIEQLELVQFPFWSAAESIPPEFAEVGRHGNKVLLVALGASDGKPERHRRMAEAVASWNGLSVAIQCDELDEVLDPEHAFKGLGALGRHVQDALPSL